VKSGNKQKVTYGGGGYGGGGYVVGDKRNSTYY